jgi:hypothetical protein
MTGVVAKGAKRNVKAERLPTANAGTTVLAAYFDESPTLFAAEPYDQGGSVPML